ncbi:23S rRNA m(1)G-745 methyltransferase [Azonexus fungiphilus]|uniref:23S rRNA m(1)G-745 methyltransferase n=1 Tax=Azonexus fungiphilus TaxID=146940 RepID=A0A495WIS5_9RHOO|nr:methyltransferase domain-containing protein [Azonexus fungiphilus]RKT60543.1 23S rRNA m(1)G-745 methyltransferase [Azonexus fungiphilus]
MATTAFTALACPLDGAPLAPVDGGWTCPAGHRYDQAAQGYVNLLPVQHKRSRDPGDSKEMVAARRRFLEAGHYRPIAELAARAALTELPPDAACLDAGCGEGYYLRQLAAAAGATGKSPALLGLDISKWAVQAAAKAQRGTATWVVGSNARLPVLPATLDRVLCLFGFPVYPEFARALKPGGQLIMIDAGPDHLRELREIIYPTLKPPRSGEAPLPEGFAAAPGDSLCQTLTLNDAASIADLLAMTPHLYRATPEGRARAAALQTLTLTVDVRLSRFLRI